MKKTLLPFYFLFLIPHSLFSQNVGIGTTTPKAKLHIKGTADTTQLIIEANNSQSNTKPLISLRKSDGTDLLWIHTDNPTNSFIGLSAGKTNDAGGGGLYNTFIGAGAGYSNTAGHSNTAIGLGAFYTNTTGFSNTVTGVNALYKNTTGFDNSAFGRDALYSNTTGKSNLAFGVGALSANTTGLSNTAIGVNALQNNTIANDNVAIGQDALRYNTTGIDNVAVGIWALKNFITGGSNVAIGNYSQVSTISNEFSVNTSIGTFSMASNLVGEGNTVVGYQALYNANANNNTVIGENALYNDISGGANVAIGNAALLKTTGSGLNVAVGCFAGDAFDNGYNNVFVGAHTDVGSAGLFNVIAIGQGTLVTASSTARFGNAATTSYGGWAGWTNVSDGRFKKNIRENIPGIEFINKLRPVTYTLDATGLDAFQRKNETPENKAKADSNTWHKTALLEKEKVTYTGFIAQEVEIVAKQLGFDFSGVDKPKNENDTYGLRYAEFVVPLVKAVQEQQVLIKNLEKRIALLEEQYKNNVTENQ